MQDHRDKATSSSGFRRFAGWLLVIAGTAMLGWCAYFLLDGYLAQEQARRALESAPSGARQPAPAETGRADVAPPVALARGTAVADLSIPRIRLSAVVLHGSDMKTLRRGPGHLENTALPGEAGNAVIAGHRDTFFRPLQSIKVGDDIYTETPSGRFHYRVTDTRVVKPQDLGVLDPTDEPTLTLITCYPFWVFGDAPDRFVVRAVGVDEPAATAFRPAVERPHELVPVPPPPRPRAVSTRVLDDETMVRQVVERFRATYNARLASHGELSGRMLVFGSCEVTVDGDTASAVCTGKDAASDGIELRGRSFLLERSPEGWAIRSVVAR